MSHNDLTINDLVRRAEVVRDRYGSTVNITLTVYLFRMGDIVNEPQIEFILHSIGSGEKDKWVNAPSLETCESQLDAALNPANRLEIKLSEAEKLEAQAAALRREVKQLTLEGSKT